MNQVGLISTAQTTSVSYTPNDKLLPSVTVSLDTEINHLVKIGAVIGVVACIYVPEVIMAAGLPVTEFLTDIGTYTPVFS